VWRENVVYGVIELGRCFSCVHVVCVDTGARMLQECVAYIHRVMRFGGSRNVTAVGCAASNFRAI
jgi:hypothetical protein